MSNLMLTLIIAFIVLIFAIAAMAIGWLITGKSKIEAGACGRQPGERRDDTCGEKISCTLCQPESKSSTMDQKHVDLSEEQSEDDSEAI